MKKILFFIILLLMASEMNFAQRPFQERPFHPQVSGIGNHEAGRAGRRLGRVTLGITAYFIPG